MMHKRLFFGCTLMGAIAAIACAMGADSGLNVGESVTTFHPTHVAGPLKGTEKCPPCTYGAQPQVLVWVNADKGQNVRDLAKLLNDATEVKKDSNLRAFVIYLTDDLHAPALREQLPKMAERVGSSIHIAYMNRSNEAIAKYKINTSAEVKNTVIVYKNKKVTDKFVNLAADEKGKAALTQAVNKITG